MFKGVVFKSTGSWYSVKDISNNKITECKIKGVFRLKGIKDTNPIAVGDEVEYEFIENDKTGVISKIFERKNYIIRQATNLSKQSHIIASNLDQILLIACISKPRTSLGFIDRVLVTAESYHVPANIIFNKLDSYNDAELEHLNEITELYRKINYNVVHISATENINLDKVKDILKDKTSLIIGHSGVGKSSIINAIQPDLNLKIKPISSVHEKGMHSTTFAEMFELSFGGRIIDTPGIKEFGLFNTSKNELAHRFPEMMKYVNKCKFNNCIHVNEPGCEVKKAVENGEINYDRYYNYVKMLEDTNLF